MDPNEVNDPEASEDELDEPSDSDSESPCGLPTEPVPGPRVFNLQAHPGFVVIGINYCQPSKEAVAMLIRHRMPFVFAQASHGRHAYYWEMFRAQRSKPYLEESQEEYEARGSPEHTTAPLVLLDQELVGGRDELRAFLTHSSSEKLSLLRQRLNGACATMLAIPPNVDGNRVLESLVDRAVEVVAQDQDCLRYVPCESGVPASEYSGADGPHPASLADER